MKAKRYYFKNATGKVVSTMGVELDEWEQQALCRENLRRINEWQKNEKDK